jgi:glyoxylase I family protein
MNISVEHIAISAADPVALKNWYERVLGAREIWNSGQVPPTFLVALPDQDFDPGAETQPSLRDGMWLEIYPANAEKNPARGDNKMAGFRHMALRVDSLETARAELEKRGVKFTGEIRPAAGGGSVLFFADCEGNLLHFVERPADFNLGKL